MRRIWLAFLLVLSVGFSAPSVAFADDGVVGSFTDGLQTLVSPESVQVEHMVSPEDEYLESYEPVLVEPVRESAEDVTELDGMGGIQQVVNRANTIEWSSSTRPLWDAVRVFFVSTKAFLLELAVGICFFWWGLRKGVRMVMSAWRSGRASV